MPFNGTGTFNNLYDWTKDFDPATGKRKIDSTKMQAQDTDIASALSNCLTRDGQGKPNAALDFNGQNVSNVGTFAATGGRFTGITFGDNTTLGTAPPGRNRVINGAMFIDQRNGGASVSSGLGTLTYVADRFYVYATGAAVTAQRVVGSGVYNYGLRVTGAAGNTYVDIGQRIESYNCLDLDSQTITVSAYIAASVATSITMVVTAVTAQDNYNTGSYTVISSTTQITNLITRYTWVIPTNAGVSNGMSVAFRFPSGLTGGTFTLSGVQVEKGNAATPFEVRPYGTELALCQRYYSEVSVTPTTASVYSYAALPVTMRVVPTITVKSGTLNGATYTGAPYGSSSVRQNTNSAGASDALLALNSEL